MNEKSKEYINIKQIITIIFIAIIVFLGIYFKDKPENTLNELDDNVISYELSNVPEYTNEPYIILNNNIPNFKESDFTTNSFEQYSELDKLGRCGVAFANLSKETMPTEERKNITFEPTGWINKRYPEIISGEYLYNRCHLIAFSLSAENNNKRNLITGTKYFNVNGMLPNETKVLNYLKENENSHILYRVTPIFKENNLIASGVTMEAMSVEDRGKSLQFYVYVYNVQPGITIDYRTGESELSK